MPAIATLYEPIAADLHKVCQILDDELFSDLPIINDLCEEVGRFRGKMLRPALLLLAARACGSVRPQHLTLAAVLELVHMATLVHDDVLDDADLRRRHPTIHRLHGNEAAILLGDYLISHAFHLCSSLDSQYASRKIGAATNTVCEGELQQVHHRGDCSLTPEQYFQIVGAKTAALTATACHLGAYFAGAESPAVAAMEKYGLDTGVAFQITDDLLDIVGSEQSTGKTLGRDLAKDKLTLPVIHALSEASSGGRRELLALLHQPEIDRARLQELLRKTDSITFTLTVARRYIESAVASLGEIPPSDARDTLASLARMIATREQ